MTFFGVPVQYARVPTEAFLKNVYGPSIKGDSHAEVGLVLAVPQLKQSSSGLRF